MNKQESDILNVILQYHCRNQRALAERCGFSLGMVNRSVKALQGQGFLTTDMELTEKARLEMAKHRPKNAVILAAGYGMRMVPINMETPKGLLEVEGEPLIERLIRQLHVVNVKEIYVVVGFKKEQYDYLVDQYGVKLVVNMEYAEKNNLHSLAKVLPQLGETYLMPCDLWCRENPFSEYEWYSWYLVSDAKDPDSTVRVSRKWELVPQGGEKEGNHMIGISYLTDPVAQSMARRIETMVQDRRYDHVFWEDALFAENGMPVQAKLVPEGSQSLHGKFQCNPQISQYTDDTSNREGNGRQSLTDTLPSPLTGSADTFSPHPRTERKPSAHAETFRNQTHGFSRTDGNKRRYPARAVRSDTIFCFLE